MTAIDTPEIRPADGIMAVPYIVTREPDGFLCEPAPCPLDLAPFPTNWDGISETFQLTLVQRCAVRVIHRQLIRSGIGRDAAARVSASAGYHMHKANMFLCDTHLDQISALPDEQKLATIRNHEATVAAAIRAREASR